MENRKSSARKTPFHDVTTELGAEFTELFGSLWPDHFGDVDAEYRAQRESVAVFDASPINKWEFRGPDAEVAAQRVHTNNVVGAAFGQVRYGAFCDADGQMIDDGTVFKLASDHLWVMTNKNTRAEHFANATSDLDVQIEDITEDLPHLFFQGPGSREALAPITDADLTRLGWFRFYPEQVTVAGIPVWLSRTGVSGELGYELFCRPDVAPDLLRALLRETGARPYGLTAIEPVRIESGIIVTDTDYPEHTYTPYDVSFDHLIDLRRDFLGRDALAALEPEPRRYRLTTLRLDAEELPEYGTALTREGERVGTLTSPTLSPYAGPIALAIVEAPLAVPGTRLEVASGGSPSGAVVHKSHPAYDPEKRRPRS
ncbi:aminomethyltransferase family protein [Streptomyces qaidamensis]|uniref:aminomethyltransferase family protein n=1 Tax=Streptomyces qaidamensis TaxID=1783515 RepID=UPI0036585BAD